MFSIDSTTYTSKNYEARPDGILPWAIIVHSCEGKPLGDEQRSSIPWLCNPKSGASSHYYITREGVIYQLIPDRFRAWHAGRSVLAGVSDVNDFSIGIELEHRESGMPYPQIQIDALTWLCRLKMKEYRIPPELVASHRQVARAAGRTDRHDPSDWPEAGFRLWANTLVATVTPLPTPKRYTAASRLLGPSGADVVRLSAAILMKPTGEYSAHDIGNVIMPVYADLCSRVGLDLALVTAQIIHETGNFTSFWASRPQRNPAGIGVNGTKQSARPADTRGWAYNAAQRRWEMGLSFPTWSEAAIPNHIGRLLAFALTDAQATPEQRELIDLALRSRPLPSPKIRGSAPTLKQLGKVHNASGYGWADKGTTYGASIATIANRLVGL